MRRISLVITIFFGTFLFGFYCFNNFFSRTSIVGVYANKNFDYQGRLTEIPYQSDTLKLFNNNTFSSSFWGSGTYALKYSLTGTKIKLVYNYKYGKAGLSTQISRLYGFKPKILLDRDRNHYLEKINL